MKKCLQCGNKFDDKFSFCPECGQQLVADNSCPQCGAEIAPGAKFCPNCGARLAPQAAPQAAPAPQQPAPAPAPAPQPAPTPAPAPAPVYAAPQPAPQQRPAKQKGEVLQKVLRFVYLGLFCLFSFLFLLGMFGDPFQANAMGYTQAQSVSYFFGDAMQPYSDISSASQGFGMFMTVLHMLSYYGALIGLCICIPIGIVKVTKAVKAKAPIDTKMLSGMVVSVIPYLFLTGVIAFYKVSGGGSVAQYEYGWGTTMIFVMVILSIVTMTVYKVFGGKLNVKEIIANSLCGVGYLAAVLMAVFSNTLLVSASQYGTTYDYTLYSRVLETIDAADMFELFPFLMIGFLFSLVSAGLMIGSVNAPKSRRLGRVIPMLVIATVLNMTACVLGGIAMNDLYGGMYDIIPGVSVGSIMTIVLFIVELGSVIAAVSVAKPSNPAPMQPQPQPLPQPQDPNQGYRG